MPQTITTFDSVPLQVLALYRLAHARKSADLLGHTVLHVGPQYTVVAWGRAHQAPSLVLTLALGHERTAREFFRGAVPTPLELETAIALVEDEVHVAHRHYGEATLAEGPAAGSAWAADAGLHELATLAGIAPGAVRDVPLDAVERLFNRLVSVSEGRPAAREGLPEDPAFAARLLVLRELMHHMPFAALTLLSPPVEHEIA